MLVRSERPTPSRRMAPSPTSSQHCEQASEQLAELHTRLAQGTYYAVADATLKLAV